ncbi:GTPase RhebL1 isoform X1 [Accipiter gentilis]|uniref:GTPase RhebL1 isoform X1 n=1 Tax=Astur gentilis TaxID=8957 RepID=UPI00210F5789|nr:GTPase RhebL1 isoform X1 [Accipiter gentilis]
MNGLSAASAPAPSSRPHPRRCSVANRSGWAGGVVVTWGYWCSGGGTAPPPPPARRGGRFIAPCIAPARTAGHAAGALPQSAHPRAKPPWPTSSWRESSWNATSPRWRAPTTRWWWWVRMSSSSNWWTQPGSMPVVLVGNKADLSLQSREVKTDEGKKLAESWGAIFLESSAKENQVTQGIFMKIIEEIDRLDNSYSRSTGCRLM